MFKIHKVLQGGVLVFWDNHMLELVGLEIGAFSMSYRFKNCDDNFVWVFIGVYNPTARRNREGLWAELGAIKGFME